MAERRLPESIQWLADRIRRSSNSHLTDTTSSEVDAAPLFYQVPQAASQQRESFVPPFRPNEVVDSADTIPSQQDPKGVSSMTETYVPQPFLNKQLAESPTHDFGPDASPATRRFGKVGLLKVGEIRQIADYSVHESKPVEALEPGDVGYSRSPQAEAVEPRSRYYSS